MAASASLAPPQFLQSILPHSCNYKINVTISGLPSSSFNSFASSALISTTSFPSSSLGVIRRDHELVFTTCVSFNPTGNFDFSLEEDTSPAPPPLPPTEGRFEVVIDNGVIQRLDISPVRGLIGDKEYAEDHDSPNDRRVIIPKDLLKKTIGFTINYKREDPLDPRELSEFGDIRLWFVRLDTVYPWLPVVLDWRAGELARYAAMLVPHQISMSKGVVFNPEALELFVLKKVFIVYKWLKHNQVPRPEVKTSDMARMLGFGIETELYDLVDDDPYA